MDCYWHYHDGITMSNYCDFKIDCSLNLLEKLFKGDQVNWSTQKWHYRFSSWKFEHTWASYQISCSVNFSEWEAKVLKW